MSDSSAVACLFHIGLPKTGTSALQFTAASRRQVLLDQGLFYPDIGPNPGTIAPAFHNQSGAVAAVLRADRSGTLSRNTRTRELGRWDGLLRRIAASGAPRTLISAENASGASARAVAMFRRTLPPRTHIVVTVRNHAERVASVWQQRIRNAVETRHFDPWLRSILADERDPSIDARLWDRMHADGIVRRWMDAFGRDNLTVVVVDKREPTLLYGAVEDLLSMTRGSLSPDPDGGAVTRRNRGMTVDEVSFARRVVETLDSAGIAPTETKPLLHRGGFLRVQETRVPPENEPRLALPAWAAERAAAIGARQSEEIAAMGARVVGDLDALGRPTPAAETDPADNASVATDIAVHTVVGTVLAALGRDPVSGQPSE